MTCTLFLLRSLWRKFLGFQLIWGVETTILTKFLKNGVGWGGGWEGGGEEIRSTVKSGIFPCGRFENVFDIQMSTA